MMIPLDIPVGTDLGAPHEAAAALGVDVNQVWMFQYVGLLDFHLGAYTFTVTAHTLPPARSWRDTFTTTVDGAAGHAAVNGDEWYDPRDDRPTWSEL